MDRRLIELHVENFRSLRKVTIPLGPVNVLIGPNGAGKTNVLEVFRFLADVARTDLKSALDERGKYRDVVFRGGDEIPPVIQIRLNGAWTSYSNKNALDEFVLELRLIANKVAYRDAVRFKRTNGPGRRVNHDLRRDFPDAGYSPEEGVEWSYDRDTMKWFLRKPGELADIAGQADPAEFTEGLASLRHVDVDALIASDVAAGLFALHADGPTWKRMIEDAGQLIPQLEGIDFENASDVDGASVVLHEQGLRRPTPLTDASSGTVRLLGLLAMLYDPNPPALTCVDGIDRGIHPQALELLAERVREASERTQFLITTHSPTLVDRLKPEELIICERGDDGASVIPAVPTGKLKEIVAEAQRAPMGGLWFSGALGGDL